jgi:hypothetical protein
MSSINEYKRFNNIHFVMSRKAAKLLVIALDLKETRISLSIEIAAGLIDLTEGYFVTARCLYQIYGNAIRTYPMPLGWAVGVSEIPFVASCPSSSWAGGERLENFVVKESGILTIPDGLTGEITYRVCEASEPISNGVYGNKSFMGGFVD